MMVMIGCW